MSATARAFTVASALLLAARAGGAQTLAARVADAPDGVVRLEVPSRPGTCGDGRDMIGFRDAMFGRNFRAMGRGWHDVPCVPGPLRVTLDVTDGRVRDVRVQVGGRWAPVGSRVTDLGVVEAAEASAFFFALAPRFEQSRAGERVLVPAVLADVDAVPRLKALAADADRARSVREQAMMWLALVGDAPEGRWLLDRARDDRESMSLRKTALFWAGQAEATPTADVVRIYRVVPDTRMREHAIFVISQRRDDAATDSLIRIATEPGDADLRGKALFWLAQKDDPRVRKLISDLVLR